MATKQIHTKFNSFINESIKGEYYVDSLEGEDFEGTSFDNNDYGVFFTGSKELGKEGHCYYYGSKKDAEQRAEELNKNLKNRGYLAI